MPWCGAWSGPSPTTETRPAPSEGLSKWLMRGLRRRGALRLRPSPTRPVGGPARQFSRESLNPIGAALWNNRTTLRASPGFVGGLSGWWWRDSVGAAVTAAHLHAHLRPGLHRAGGAPTRATASPSPSRPSSGGPPTSSVRSVSRRCIPCGVRTRPASCPGSPRSAACPSTRRSATRPMQAPQRTEMRSRARHHARAALARQPARV